MLKVLPLLAVLTAIILSGSAKASDELILRVVARNGMVLQLDATTIVKSRIDETTVGYRDATPEKPVYQVHFKLTKKAGRDFHKLTEANVGKPIRFILGERVISNPIVRNSIMGGAGIVSTRSRSEAEAVLVAMRGANP